MSYWFPRISLMLVLGVAIALSLMTGASEDVVYTLIAVTLGLGLFSLTLHGSPTERN